MLLPIRLLLCLLGATLIAFAFFLYEDKERTIHSRLNDYWLDIDNQSLSLLTTSRSGTARWLARVLSFIQNTFGDKIFSVRAALAATALSLSSSIAILNAMIWWYRATPMSARDRLLLELFLLAWSLCLLYLSRRHPIVSVAIWFAPWAYIIWTISGRRIFYAEFAFTLLALFLGVLTGLSIMAALRNLLRGQLTPIFSWIPPALSLATIIFFFALFCVVPPALLFHNILELRLLINSNQSEELFVLLLLFLNASNFLIILIFPALIVLLFLHHVLWPTLRRALNAIPRTKLISRREILGSIGFAVLAVGYTLKHSWVQPVVTLLKALLGRST